MTDNDNPTSRESDPIIHPRRELSEHGLLPIPKLIFSDGNQTLTYINDKFLNLSASSSTHQDSFSHSIAISETLQISLDHARLLLDTLASVLHCDSDPLVTADSAEVDGGWIRAYPFIKNFNSIHFNVILLAHEDLATYTTNGNP
ncbi:uncharacterized protein LOC124920594 isoform X2 [Impatiens glandulifera]|uniref:uncharacterized protein LOC124920594 isoform X2 n=1 Tax=Impatiens glandulifera TaxID=253017 RepID=UPI001FB0F52B|nr:uncharacterized protein LOC124920594 isoform X2 [Impatiens glandulifera]